MAKKAFHDEKQLFSEKMNLVLKNRIVKCLVWSIATYAAETWTLTETDRRRLEAFENVDLDTNGEDQLDGSNQ